MSIMSSRIPLRWLLATAMVAGAGVCSGSAQARAGGDIAPVMVDYEFPPPEVVPLADGSDRVRMKGLARWGAPGEPVLPYHTCYILLPSAGPVTNMEVRESEWTQLPGRYLVEHGQRPLPLSHTGEATRTPRDPAVYSSADAVPGSSWSDFSIQRWRGHAILVLNLFPVRYTPSERELRWCRRMSVTVEISPAAPADEAKMLAPSLAPGDLNYLRRQVDNPERVALNASAAETRPRGVGSLLEPTPAYDYVIITSEALASAGGTYVLQDLLTQKEQQGMAADLVTTEWIYANYSGTRPDGGVDNQTKIRNFIIDAYNTWGTHYVLLAGDADGANVGGESGNLVIPHRGFTASDEYWVMETDIPADMYYGCLDGSFDHDEDGYYGEATDGLGGGEVDLLAEVHIGRAPVDSAQEVSNFVAKQLAYADDPPPGNVCMVGERLGFGGVSEFGAYSKDEIKGGSSAHGYVTVGFLDSQLSPSYSVTTLYDLDDPGNDWPPAQLIGIINSGVHAINHLGHADVAYMMKLINSDVDALTNTSYFIGYSQGCYGGAFDNRSSIPGSYVSADCISEHFTCGPHGAAAFIANSRYGWGAFYSTDGPSQHFDREFWDAVLGEGISNIAAANDDSKWDQAGYVSMDVVGRFCCYELNVFGDPQLMIKLGVSSRGIVALNQDSYAIDGTAEITVLDSDLNLNGAAPDVVMVEIESTTETTPETVTCTETSNGSAVFRGSIALASGAAAADGTLQVSHADTVTVTYIDADDGAGGTDLTRDDTAFVDGAAPSFAGLDAADAGDALVILGWSAAGDDTPPVGYLVYRADAPGTYDFGAPIASTHETTYRDETVSNWQTYYYVVRAVDRVGNVDSNTNERLATPRQVRVYHDYPLDTDPGWTCEGGWEFGPPQGKGSECCDPSTAYTGTNVYGYNLSGNYPDHLVGECLISNAFDCSNLPVVSLRFRRWLGVETAYYDHAAVEVSSDGVNWSLVWENSSADICDGEWVLCEYDISDVAAREPTVYVRWRMGPTDYTVTYPGWNIDDIEVLGLGDITSAGNVDLDSTLYAVGGEPVVAICDSDLNVTPGAPDFATAEIVSTTEAAAEIVTCTETAPSSAVFVGSIPLSPGAPASDGELQVAHDDIITVLYVDADDGAGGIDVEQTDVARIDGRAPRFGGVRCAFAGDGYVLLSWSAATDDTPPVQYAVYRADFPGGQDFGSPLAITEQTTYRDGQVTNGETYYYVVRAQDGIGNGDDNILQRTATPGALSAVYTNPLDTDPGWTRQPGWAFGPPEGGGSHCGDPPSAHTGVNVFGYNLAGDYHDDITRPFYLATRAIDCSELLSVTLRFWRWLGVEDAWWDHAALDVSADGFNWETVWEHTGATVCDGAWVLCSYDISDVAARQASVWVRWAMGPSDWMVTYPGWNIDDIEVLGAPATILFPDVQPAFWAFDEIQGCYHGGVVQGYPDGSYSPATPVTRDQMAVFIARALAGGDDNVPDGPTEATFDDVPIDHWAFKYVEYCVANGIVQGYDPVTYSPATQVSRDQMAVFVSRAVAGGDGNVPDGPSEGTFNDVPTGHWAFKYVEYCVASGIVQGYDPVTYMPAAIVSRDQMAVYICRAFGLPM